VEGRPLEEPELVARASGGDAHAYEELVRTHQQVAMRTAWLVTRNATEAEDAVQEAFVKAYRALRLGRFREGAAFRPWLLAIVANEARNRRRSVARSDRLAIRVAEVRPSGDAAPSPEAAAVAAEDRRRLLESVNALDENDRLVIATRYFLELNSEETAAALGVPEGTVKSRLSRALGRLRERVEAQTGG
jgi:RNA polymerase sigma factor (sigma-70 family)